jgi:hypothetical protein
MVMHKNNKYGIGRLFYFKTRPDEFYRGRMSFCFKIIGLISVSILNISGARALPPSALDFLKGMFKT